MQVNFKIFLQAIFCLTLALQFIFKANAYNEVKVNGLFRFSEDATIEALQLKDKQAVTDEDLSQEVKNLYSTGLFSNVSLTYQDGNLTIDVVEVPVVADVKFNGLKQFKKDMIMKEITTQNRSFYSKADVIADAKKIQTIYKTLGVLDATVEPLIEFLEGGKIFVIFNIKEGKPKKIQNIFITGNKVFGDYTLKEELSIKEDTLFRLISGKTTYNISTTLSDVERIKYYYQKNGYFNAKITYQIVTLNDNRDTVDINIFIEEGEKFKFGEYKVIKNIPNLEIKNEKALIRFKKGTKYNISQVQESQYKIQQLLNREGFLLSKTTVDYKVDNENKIVDVTFAINPAKRLFINRINIVGNLKTNDNVLRREFSFSEGDVYNSEMVARSVQKLRNTGLFDAVEIKEQQIGDDRVDLYLQVQEARTLSADVQFGYNFSSSFDARVNLSEANFRGTGIQTSISADKGKYSEGLSLSLVQPYFLEKELSLASATGYSNNYNPNERDYSSQSFYQIFKFGYSISEYLKHSVTYKIQSDKLGFLSSAKALSSSPLASEEVGNYLTSSIGQSFTYDKRDNAGLPNNGYFIEYGQTVAGVGGNVFHFQNEVRLEQYFELFDIDDSVIGFKLKFKNIMGIAGRNVNIKDRFTAGEYSGLRGFDPSGVGPKFSYSPQPEVNPLFCILFEQCTAVPYKNYNYGGKNMFVGNIEYRFPNFLPKEFGFTTFAFFDFGSVWGYDPLKSPQTTGKYKILDSKKLRTSVGVGLSWRSPIGLITIGVAKPLQYEEFDETKRFYFSIGGISF
jgi:outer membrane protein insertion porin family